MREYNFNAFGSPTQAPGEEIEKREDVDAEKRQRVLMIRIVAAFATVLFLIMIVGLIINFVSLGRLNAKKKALQRELNAINAQIAAGESMIDDYTLPSYIDRYAREQLGMIGKDEILYIGIGTTEK